MCYMSDTPPKQTNKPRKIKRNKPDQRFKKCFRNESCKADSDEKQVWAALEHLWIAAQSFLSDILAKNNKNVAVKG